MDVTERRNYLNRYELKKKTGLSDLDVIKLQISGELIPAKKSKGGLRYYLLTDVLHWLEKSKETKPTVQG